VKLWLRYRDFCDFQDYGRSRLGFSKIRNFNSQPLVRGQYVLPYQISSKSTERLRIYGDLTVFQNGGRLPSYICWARIWITHEEHLVVFSVVQNLIEIDAVVLIICRFRCFARSLFTPPKKNMGVLGNVIPLSEENQQRDLQKAHRAETRHMTIGCRNRSRHRGKRVPKNKVNKNEKG